MTTFKWSIAGVLCVGIPFASLYDPYSLWGSVIAGGIGGGVYVAALVVSFWSEMPSKAERFLSATVTLLLLAGFTLLTDTQYRMSSFQHELLIKIRTVIGSGIILSDKIHESMLPVFQAYHRQPQEKRRSIVPLFHDMYPNAATDGTFNSDRRGEMDALTYLTFQGDTAVRYVCVDTAGRGWKKEFRNASGHFGKLEYHASLTAKGVRYERIN
jgi:hypothetical protein